jgi:hypothetical protein
MTACVAFALTAALATAFEPADVRGRIQTLYDERRFEEALALTINEYRASGGEAVFLYAGASSASALADCHQAIELYERALPQADSADIKQAIVEELEACRGKVSEQPEVHLPATFPLRWAEAERALGNCEAATRSYRRVLRRDATEDERAAAEVGLQACRPKPEPQPPAVTDVDRPAPRPRPDPWTPALMATGGVTLATGVGLIGGAFIDARRARDADESQFVDQTQRANRLLVAGIVVGGVGVAILTAATIRLVLRRRRARKGPARTGARGLRAPGPGIAPLPVSWSAPAVK